MNYTTAKADILEKLKTQLAPELYYHSLEHTLDVLAITTELCQLEKVSAYHAQLLKTAALFHDSGFTIAAEEHEKLSCNIARETLPKYGYTSAEIGQICGMIMATKIPQSPKNKLEQILSDADLDYLGRKDFYPIGKQLFKELKHRNPLFAEEVWNRIQVSFLEAHQYFTTTNKQRRAPQKALYLQELKNLVATYP